MTKVDPAEIQAALTAEFQRQAAQVAGFVQRIADDVVRHSEVWHHLDDLLPDHASAASEIVRDIQRLVGNLPLDALLRAAADADRYARTRRD